jgi:hypothetical protein
MLVAAQAWLEVDRRRVDSRFLSIAATQAFLLNYLAWKASLNLP